MAYVPPASGRASIVNTLNGALITIPPRRNWFIILFLGAWTGGWAFGGGMALLSLFKPDMPVLARGFMFFWLCGWAAALWFVGRTLYLQFRGNEVISVTRETLSITRPGRFRTTQRSYSLNDVRRLRVHADQGASAFGMLRSNGLHEQVGTLRFDHGMGSVTFAAGIDEPEARHILTFLRDQGLINEANLA